MDYLCTDTGSAWKCLGSSLRLVTGDTCTHASRHLVARGQAPTQPLGSSERLCGCLSSFSTRRGNRETILQAWHKASMRCKVLQIVSGTPLYTPTIHTPNQLITTNTAPSLLLLILSFLLLRGQIRLFPAATTIISILMRQSQTEHLLRTR